MRKLAAALLVAFLSFSMVGHAIDKPTIARKDNTFTITYAPGAVWACTVFRMVEKTETDLQLWPDGHYAPRSCGPLAEHSMQYVEEWSQFIYDPKTGKDYDVDWEVYAEIQYSNGRGTFATLETNHVPYHR